MPKPIFQDNGSGMHTHQSLWKDGEPLFFDETGYAGLSDIARWYIGGLLHHAPAILAFAAPTTNSLQAARARLRGARSTSCTRSATGRRRAASRSRRRARRPSASSSAAPTPRRNPYLAFSAMLMAGLDGMQNRIEPPAPVDKDLYDLPPEELAKVPQVPGSLDESLERPRGRQRLPDRRAACSPTTSSRPTSSTSARTRSTRIRLRPHPYEFALYYDI